MTTEGVRGEIAEAKVSSENWHEERNRLVQILQGIESGTVKNIEEYELHQLRATSSDDIAVLKKRLAQLNARLGDGQV